jgi:hypothetical protein
MRLDEVVAASSRPEVIEAGAAVRVCTRMGREVAEGVALYPTTQGACVSGRFYDAGLYMFVPVHARAQVEEAKAKSGEKGKDGLGRLDPEALPDDVRMAVTVDHDLDEESVQRVLAAVGDAAKDALSGVGMREDELYARVAAILERVREVLEVGEGESEDASKAKKRVDKSSKTKRKAAKADEE